MTWLEAPQQATRWPLSKPRQGRRWRIAAGAVSTGVHLVAGFFLFSSASGGLVSAAAGGGGPEGPVFSVEVVRAEDVGAAPRASASQLEPLFAKYNVAPDENAIPLQASEAPSRLTDLARRLTMTENTSAEQNPGQQAKSQSGSQHPSARPLPNRAAKGDRGPARTDSGAVNSTSTGDLWGKIEPCWRSIHGRVNVPVSLEVKLDTRGRLEGPPKILRASSAAIDEPRLKAEAAAVAALAACLPRNDIRFGGKVHRLDFRE